MKRRPPGPMQVVERGVSGNYGPTDSPAHCARRPDRIGRLASDEQPLAPLSFEQEGVWLLSRVDSEVSASYNIVFGFEVAGVFDEEAFIAAVDHVVERHDSLRLCVREVDGVPHQFATARGVTCVAVEDPRRLFSVAKIGETERRRPFDLSRERPIRIRLFRCRRSRVGIVFTFHHIAFDGWSSRNFFYELTELYRARLTVRLPILQTLSTTYLAHARQQRELADVHECQVKYWEGILRGMPTKVDLPVRQNPKLNGGAAGTLAFSFSGHVTQSVRDASARYRVTPFLLLLATFQLLVIKYTGQRDFGIRIPVANRNDPNLDPLIGMFVNMIILRTNVLSDESFTDLLEKTAARFTEAVDYQNAPFSQVVTRLRVDRNSLREPLSDLAFNFIHGADVELSLEPAIVRKIPVKVCSAKDDLMLEISELEGCFHCTFVYRKVVFEKAIVAQMARHYRSLLTFVLVHPKVPILELPLLADIERHQLLVEWNATGTSYPAGKCIHELFEENARKRPDNVAVIYETAYLTYAQLNRKANQLAYFLRHLGITPDVRVGLCMERSLEMVVALLGILKAGGAYVPLDPSYPADRLRYMVSDAQSPVLLTHEHLLERVQQTNATVVCLEHESVTIDKFPVADPDTVSTPQHLAYSMYTSGSTGEPKGIDITIRGVVKLVSNVDYVQITDRDIFLQAAPLSFDAATFEIWGALLNGATLVIMPSGRYSSEDLGLIVATKGITILWLTAAMFEQIVRTNISCLRRVKQLLTGGDVIPLPAARKLLRKFPRCQLINGYGPTECTTFACCYRVPKSIRSSSIPIGRPIANTQIYILDDALNPVPVGIPGEIHIAGAGLARGYLNRPALTAEMFIPDPFDAGTSGARLYRTGDRGRYLKNGAIEFLGRRDHQVKIRGFRVELGEVEAALRETFCLGDVVVIAREDVPGDKRLVAYLACRGVTAPVPNDLRAALKRRLPEYLVPASFVFLDALPLNANGKVDRNALPAPNISAPVLKYLSVQTSTSIEQVLRQIWIDVLKTDDVGVDDDFFALGGHSLLATQILSRVQKSFAVRIPLREFFASPCIRSVARIVATLRSKRVQHPLPSIRRRGCVSPIALSFAQQRLWFLDQYQPNSAVYSVPTAVRLRGPLKRDVLLKVLTTIIDRHEALRTVFKEENGLPAQHVLPDANLTYDVLEISTVGECSLEEQLREIVQSEIDETFDLEHGPLIRAKVIVVDENDHVLLINLHHIVSDAWSVDILLRELFLLYRAFQWGRPSPLPALPIQYGDFAVWQRQTITHRGMLDGLHYWKKLLVGATSRLELPVDYPRPLIRTYDGGTVRFSLPPSLVDRLRQLTKRTNTTSFIALFAAFNVMLSRYTHQNDICVGYPAACRSIPDVEGLIGFFVNTLVLRTYVDWHVPFLSILKQVRDRVFDADTYAEVPFEKLVEELNPERDLSRSPLFEAMFAHYPALTTDVPIPGLSSAVLDVDSRVSKFDLTLSFRESARDLIGTFEYNTRLFQRPTIDRMADHFRTLLEGIVSDPTARTGDLPLLTKTEREQVLRKWNDTVSAYPADRCIHELFELQASRTPQAIAVETATEQLTYQRLNEKANQLARYLRQVGVGSEQLVAICLRRSTTMMIAILGILKAGGAYLPLDPTSPRRRLSRILKDSRARVIVTEADLVALVRSDSATLNVCLDRHWELIEESSDSNLHQRVGPENLVYCIYTSGSTGKPKGVLVSHANLVASTHARTRLYEPVDRLLLVSPIAFDTAAAGIWQTLLTGGRLILPSDTEAKDPEELCRLVKQSRINHFFCVPSLYVSLLECALRPTTYLSAVTVCGEECSADLVEMHNELMPQVRLFNEYGPTECTVWATAFAMSDYGDEYLPHCRVPIGRPIANTQIYILDESLNPAPIGIAGQIYIAGQGVARGYLGRPDITAERFIPNPFCSEPGLRIYKTGDLGRYLCDGSIEFLGRVDQQVKIRGFRVELGEIESVLRRSADVIDAVVTTRDSATGAKNIVAHLICRQDRAPSVSKLRAQLWRQLPDYMVPSAFTFLDEFPVLPNGKIDRKALSRVDIVSESPREYIAPRTKLETKLATIWSETLKLQRIGINDNFFALGGHSLLAAQVVSKIRDMCGSKISLQDIFTYPSIGQLSSLIVQNRSARQKRLM